jgi:hypothetical protein
MTKLPGENHWEYLRRIVLEYADYEKDKHPIWANRKTGPYWPVLRRYVAIIDIAKQQAEYIRELQGIIEEIDEKSEDKI